MGGGGLCADPCGQESLCTMKGPAGSDQEAPIHQQAGLDQMPESLGDPQLTSEAKILASCFSVKRTLNMENEETCKQRGQNREGGSLNAWAKQKDN